MHYGRFCKVAYFLHFDIIKIFTGLKYIIFRKFSTKVFWYQIAGKASNIEIKIFFCNKKILQPKNMKKVKAPLYLFLGFFIYKLPCI